MFKKNQNVWKICAIVSRGYSWVDTTVCYSLWDLTTVTCLECSYLEPIVIGLHVLNPLTCGFHLLHHGIRREPTVVVIATDDVGTTHPFGHCYIQEQHLGTRWFLGAWIKRQLHITLTSYGRHGASNHWQFDSLWKSVHANIKEKKTHYGDWPFVRGIHRLPADSPHKGPVISKAFQLSWRHHD